jgi:hypothetical protein
VPGHVVAVAVLPFTGQDESNLSITVRSANPSSPGGGRPAEGGEAGQRTLAQPDAEELGQ